MAIPPLELQVVEIKLRAYCEKVPTEVRDRLLHVFFIKRHDVVLAEKRPHWRDPSEWVETPVAKFKYAATQRMWQLFYQDRNLKWRQYEPRFEASNFEELLQEVDQDPNCIFWG